MRNMIINILGCPRSGKTTSAAKLFTNLKENGFKSEFIPEQARFYIAQKRVHLNLKPTDNLTLTDNDQFEILLRQLETENLMLKACGEDAIIVSDSSPFNALLYMSDAYRAEDQRLSILKNEELIKDRLFFYATPVPWLGGTDPNRIHSKQQSLDIDIKIPTIIFPYLKEQPVTLTGDSFERGRDITARTIQYLMNSCITK